MCVHILITCMQCLFSTISVVLCVAVRDFDTMCYFTSLYDFLWCLSSVDTSMDGTSALVCIDRPRTCLFSSHPDRAPGHIQAIMRIATECLALYLAVEKAPFELPSADCVDALTC